MRGSADAPAAVALVVQGVASRPKAGCWRCCGGAGTRGTGCKEAVQSMDPGKRGLMMCGGFSFSMGELTPPCSGPFEHAQCGLAPRQSSARACIRPTPARPLA